jgi:hypothetical protein
LEDKKAHIYLNTKGLNFKFIFKNLRSFKAHHFQAHCAQYFCNIFGRSFKPFLVTLCGGRQVILFPASINSSCVLQPLNAIKNSRDSDGGADSQCDQFFVHFFPRKISGKIPRKIFPQKLLGKNGNFCRKSFEQLFFQEIQWNFPQKVIFHRKKCTKNRLQMSWEKFPNPFNCQTFYAEKSPSKFRIRSKIFQKLDQTKIDQSGHTGAELIKHVSESIFDPHTFVSFYIHPTKFHFRTKTCGNLRWRKSSVTEYS